LAAITSLVVAKFLGKRTLYKVAIPNDDDVRAIHKSRFGWIKSFFIKRCDKFIAISDRVRKGLETAGCSEVKIVSIPNGVEKRFYWDEKARREARQDLMKQLAFDENCRIISYVGSIQALKGIDVLARAWPRIVTQAPESRLLMVGPFIEQTNFHGELLSLLGEHFGKTVFLVGNVSDPEHYYRASDVFVFPSRNESFGNVLVEAMACGTPCVATRIEGVTDDIIKNGFDGLVVEQEDHEAMADAIVSVLRNPELGKHLGFNAAQTVTERFRMESIADKYHELYRKLLNGDDK